MRTIGDITHTCLIILFLIVGSAAQDDAQNVLLSSSSTIEGHWEWRGAGGWQRIAFDLQVVNERLTGTITMGDGLLDGGEGLPTPGVGAPVPPRLGPDLERDVPLTDVPLEEFWRYYVPSVSFEVQNGHVDGNTFEFDQIVYMFETPRVDGAPLWCCFTPADLLHYSGVVSGNRMSVSRESTAEKKETRFLGNHRFEFVATRFGEVSPVQIETPPAADTDVLRRKSVSVAVVDSAGNPVSNLGRGDFRILEGRTEAVIERFTRPEAPRNLMILVDRSLTWLSRDNLPPALLTEWDEYQIAMYTALSDAILSSFDQMQPSDHVAAAIFEESIDIALSWQNAGSDRKVDMTPLLITPNGPKDLYGAVAWALDNSERFESTHVLIFTDGRDGRLHARWFRNSDGQYVLDPLFGLTDLGEWTEFRTHLHDLVESGVSISFVAVNTDHTPQFSYDLVTSLGDRSEGVGYTWPMFAGVSELYPGATAVLSQYLSRIRARMESLALASGGRLWLVEEPQEALAIMANLPHLLNLGRGYTLEYQPSDPNASAEVTVRVSDPTLRVIPLREE